jgi:hypothetical protein
MALQQVTKFSGNQPYQLYFDLDILNNDATGDKAPIKLNFNEIRNSPYMTAPENYFMSVIRFQLQTPSLPVFIPQIQLGQTNPNLTIYDISISYNDGTTTTYQKETINYTPQDSSAPIPNQPLNIQDLSSNYYLLTSYEWWINLMNETLQTCYTNLSTAVGGFPLDSSPPFIRFDGSSFQFEFLVDKYFLYSTTTPTVLNPKITIYFNNPLQTLFCCMTSKYLGLSSIGRNHELIFYKSQSKIESIDGKTYYNIHSEGSSISLWNPIQSIVFTTGIMPVVPSSVSPPKIFNSPSSLTVGGNNSNIAPILTDFIVGFGELNTYRPIVTYVPGSEYRFSDLYGNNILNTIEISVYWKDIYGNLHPFFLNSGCFGSIKLLFRRKDFNNVDLGI